ANSFNNRNGVVGAYAVADGAEVFATPTPGVSPYDVVLADGRVLVSGAAQPDAASSDVWFAAYQTSGSQIWAQTLAGPGRDLASAVDVIGGRAYVGGQFEQTVDFDPGAGTAARTSAGASDGFAALYDAATGAFLL
ncbi:hypothetical protein, partial [Bradyrhizobium sp. NBAIM08]|uniref:hypothetical protein n=1 Tax=Bradyrhizobium sp. NBAIM08 TaxID=2793815 RepID=UPI001CD2122A